MKNYKALWLVAITVSIVFSIGLTSCQKMYRPEMVIIPDPPPPPYNPLKSYWAFEGGVVDSGENKLAASAPVNATYAAGINGQAIKFNGDGYVLIESANDTIKAPGSLTLSYWMNVAGPVQGGAQGVFAITNKNDFWGNFNIFLENLNNGNEAFLKLHMLNANATDGKGEQWNEVKIPNALGKWTHIAITYNSANSQLSIYADGQPTTINNKVLGGGNYGALKFNDVNGIVIGNHQFQTNPTRANHGAEAWAKGTIGMLDQIRIYNRALTAAEITALFTAKQ